MGSAIGIRGSGTSERGRPSQAGRSFWRYGFPVALAALGCSLIAAGPAAAVLIVDVSGSTITPNIAGAPSSMRIKGTMSDTTGAKPPPAKSVTLDFPPGGRVDPTVPSYCDLANLQTTGTCPKSSVVGTGTSTVDIRFGSISTLTADLTIYNVAPQAGEKARFVIHAIEPAVTGIVADIDGHVIPGPGGGLRLEMKELDQKIPNVFDIKPSVIAMDVTTGKITKTLSSKKRKGRKGRRAKSRPKVASYITNPPTCTGVWTVTGIFEFVDGQAFGGTQSFPCRKK